MLEPDRSPEKYAQEKTRLKTLTLREVETYRWSSWLVEVDPHCPGSLLSWIPSVLDPYCPGSLLSWIPIVHAQHIYMSNMYIFMICLLYTSDAADE